MTPDDSQTSEAVPKSSSDTKSPDEGVFDASLYPRKLNVGCGYDIREGYLNVDFQDFHHPDLVCDIRDLSVLPSAYYDEIFAQDVLEHLKREDVDPTLAEWSRLLKPGGKLLLRVPDVIGAARVLAILDTVAEHRKVLQNLYGTQAYNGDYHLAGFTELTLRASLHAVDMEVLEMERIDHWMLDCVSVKTPNLGPFDPGELPFVRACDHALPSELAVDASASVVDRVAAGVGKRLPGDVRVRLRQSWRPVRRRLVGVGVIR